jgi:uncharacterized Zn finger protein
MVHARLHVICGNCGSNNDMLFEIDQKGHDVSLNTPQFRPAVFLTCANCSTIHDLSDTVTEKQAPKSDLEDP